jgi:RNA polymerase sigma-70 factor (ECF subfamily)
MSEESVPTTEPMNTLSDEELLLRFRAGQTGAFAVLVRRYERELYGYLRRYLNDGSLAEDVFQNTFLQLYLKISQYQAGRPVRPWLYTIATRQAIDALRRQNRHAVVSLEQSAPDDTDGDAQNLLESLSSAGPGPFDETAELERREQVRREVDRLPDFLRQVLILTYYQGLKYREVADVLDIPVGTVKSRLHAALVKLHEAWSETVPPLHER